MLRIPSWVVGAPHLSWGPQLPHEKRQLELGSPTWPLCKR